jgi:prepilin-type N-terminal cleavage/methylation domain-containing protein
MRLGDRCGGWRRARGFTLIELLVVIGLIALMIGLVMPALDRARKSALAGACSSNQRQLMIGVEAMAMANDGRYPPRVPYTAAGALASLPPVITTVQNWNELPKIETARESRRRVWMMSGLTQVSVAMTVYRQDTKLMTVPILVCPDDPEPSGPFFGDWSQVEAAERSYVFNGFNDYKVPLRESQGWENQTDRHAVPQDMVLQPSDTATFGEKKSGPADAHRFYVDVYENLDPVDVLVQDRHDSGGTHTFADGSVRLLEEYASLSPSNLWGLREDVRDELTDAPGQDDPF